MSFISGARAEAEAAGPKPSSRFPAVLSKSHKTRGEGECLSVLCFLGSVTHLTMSE